MRDTVSITSVVRGIEKLYGSKKDLTLMDNNVVAAPKFREIIAEIRDLGFVPGARLARGRGTPLRRVDFNQGVDARILCKDKMFLKELSTICIKPLRIAFDHLGVKKPYEQAIRFAHEFGLTELSNYMLYNFHDSPADLFERMRLNVSLNEELGIRIFSFPMRFQPTDLPSRSHIGEKWSRYSLRSMQLILQATHGIVSGSPVYFKRAFGDTYSDFEEILRRPHHYIFNRTWYETLGGKAEFEDYQGAMAALSDSQRVELIGLLSGSDARDYPLLMKACVDSAMRRALSHYLPITKEREREIWAKTAASKEFANLRYDAPPDDELVEDAGLFDEGAAPTAVVEGRARPVLEEVAS